MPRTIAIIGERDPAKRAHLGIESSLALFQREFDPHLQFFWVRTDVLTEVSVDALLQDATAVWCAPGSPYDSTAGALLAIRHARIANKNFLGTCGGFQHALMEFARNVLGREAEHEETNPAAIGPLISQLSCSLAGVTGRVIATDRERFADILGGAEAIVEFNCNYGLNPALESIYQGTDLKFVAHDAGGQVRAFRLVGHPFFVGTLFQPERHAFTGSVHPGVRAFLHAAGKGRDRSEPPRTPGMDADESQN